MSRVGRGFGHGRGRARRWHQLDRGRETDSGLWICASPPADGSPTLPFKTKTSWAGNIEITGKTISDKPSLFFWLWGKDDTKASDDLVIWLNGGPGCSSLGGMLQENGPFLYESVKEKPFANPYSWTKEANILYVEQPVGTGFTTGKTKNTDEQQVAAQFSSFLDGFFKDFPELKGKNLYITGESYAGTYIPHIMNYLYTHGNKFNLKSGVSGRLLVEAEGIMLAVKGEILTTFFSSPSCVVSTDHCRRHHHRRCNTVRPGRL